MDLLQLADAVRQRLDVTGLTWYDGEPPTKTPAGAPAISLPGLYVCLYTSAGQVQRDRYQQASSQVLWQVTVVACATTEDGLRACTQTVRDALTDAVLDPSPAASQLSEVAAGPRLKTGPAGDQRLSQTLIYQLTTPRSINV